MNTLKTNGKTTNSPQILGIQVEEESRMKLFNKREESIKNLVFSKPFPSRPRFLSGDSATVLDLKDGGYQGFTLGDSFIVSQVESGWAYRADGNALPFSCLERNEKEEKEGIQKVESKRHQSYYRVPSNGRKMVGNSATV
jgi:hypothetical protein